VAAAPLLATGVLLAVAAGGSPWVGAALVLAALMAAGALAMTPLGARREDHRAWAAQRA